MEEEFARALLGRHFDAQESDTEEVRALCANMINVAVEVHRRNRAAELAHTTLKENGI